MKYISDDGKVFDDEFDCKDYEWKLNHPHLKDVHIFDKDGNEFNDIFSDDAYDNAEKVVVTTYEAVDDLQELAVYIGFLSYMSIDDVGEWVYNTKDHNFVIKE